MLTRRPTDNKIIKNGNQARNRNPSLKKTDYGFKIPSIVGWTGTDVMDENDIVSWMNREKKEESKKGRRSREESEDNYRHIFTRCSALADWEEFQLQSLPERYRAQDDIPQNLKENFEATVTADVLKVPSDSTKQTILITDESPQVIPEASMLYQNKDIIDDVHTRPHESDVRSHDETLTQAEKITRLKDLAGKFGLKHATIVSSDAQEEIRDEGYDSKLPNIEEAQESPPEPPKRLKAVSAQILNISNKPNTDPLLNQTSTVKSLTACHGESVEARPSNPETSLSRKLTLQCNQGRPGARSQPTNSSAPAAVWKEDSVAKLSYSGTEKNIYDVLTGGAEKIGSERSRLPEVSLRHITPGYLNTDHLLRASKPTQVSGVNRNSSTHSADRKLTLSPEVVQQIDDKVVVTRPQLQNDGQPKYLTLTKISLQEGAEADQNSLHQNRTLITNLSKAFVLPKPTKPPSKSISLMGPKASKFSPASLAIQDKHSGRPSTRQLKNPQHTEKEQTDIVELVSIHKLCSSPNFKQLTSQSEIIGDNIKTSASLPKIPFINQNMPNSLTKSSTHLSKNLPTLQAPSDTSDAVKPVTTPFSLTSEIQLSEDRSGFQQASFCSEIGIPLTLATASCEDLHSFSLLNLYDSGREGAGNKTPVTYKLHHTGHRPQGFRPYNSLSPLQRAKDIAYRRIHGYVAYLPDGSETVKVTSPQYFAPRVERLDSTNRHLDNLISGIWRPS